MTCYEFKRWRSYQRTLMAVYWLSEPDGMLCRATWADLAAEARLCVDMVKVYVRRLEEAGVVRVPKARDRPNRRTIVLLDHPGAAEYLARLENPPRGNRVAKGLRPW